MTLNTLQIAKMKALKSGDTLSKNVLANMIDAIQKATITSKGRIEPTEELVDEALIKYQKSVQEQIDTCPTDRKATLAVYKAELEIVKLYAPQLLTDKEEIKTRVEELAGAAGIELVKTSRGALMKFLSANLKGKVDMKIVSAIVGELLK